MLERFIVIHIRGSDRPCALEKLAPNQLISKIKQLGVNKLTDIVYLMTDLTSESAHLTSIVDYFKDFYLFRSSDIEIYDNRIFAQTAVFLIYASELELQEISDGIVETYRGHHMKNHGKVMGYLEPWKCLIRNKMVPFERYLTNMRSH